ncbi:MAG TPA: ATP-dependent zinc metalloprotease FtsH, partial [Acidimicrobiales bacterium]|nr:ATP-dependent zinc metalloprotease FtsH [Acidimicrobiales bacterium]
VTFADVAGLDEAVEELREIRDYLVDPERFRSLGATLPKGVLLVGPPGTGKTLLTKALAGEAGVPFQVLSAASLVEVYVGVGPARVRKIFADARKKAPSIILLDELDAIGRTRSSHAAGGQEERESTLNQLLLEMDGFDSGGGVLVVGATNRPDVLDPALLRPGRFDRRLFVSPPDLKGRRAILGVHARGKPLGPGTDLEAIARRTAGFTGADLANVMNEAALLSGRRRKRLVGREELEEAIDRLMSGPRRPSRVISALDKQVIAYHESGHVLVAWRVARGHDVHRVSVVARGQSHGHTLSVPTEDRLLVARSELLVELAVLMGGRVAEELVFADPTTGAEDDLARASALAHKMVADYGMSDMVGLLSLGSSAEAVSAAAGVALGDLRTSPVAAEVTSEVRRLLSDAHARATAILTAHRPQLDRLAERLVSAESLDKAEIDDLLADVPREPRPSRPEYDRPRARPLQLRRSMSAS